MVVIVFLILHPNLCEITVITVKCTDYCCIIYEVNESDAISLLKNSVLIDCVIV